MYFVPFRSGFRGDGEGSRSSAKVAKTDDTTFDEDDDLDDLGAAALEQYELTQRESTLTSEYRRSPTPVSDPILDIPIPRSIPASTKTTDAPKLSLGTARSKAGPSSWHNPYREATVSLQTSGGDTNTEKRIKLLQEDNFTKDGEVKVLRGEKERLMSELRKKEEQMNSIQSKILSEKQMVEEKLTKKVDTLATKLQFRDQELQAKDQELLKLREKLEQQKSVATTLRSAGVTTPKATPTGGSVKPMPSRKSEFLSTETFMPLSQMGRAGNVTPVQVGQRRGGGVSAKEEEKERDVLKKTKKRSSKSPSMSPGGFGGSTGASSSKTTATPSVSQRESEAQEKSAAKMTMSENKKHRPFVWDVSCKEPTGAQLLMLLVQRDLLKIPYVQRRKALDLDADFTDSQDNSQSSTDSQLKSVDSAHQQKLTGLLSLLHLDSNSRPVSSTMPHYSSGESSASQSSSEELSSMSISEAPPPLLADIHGGSSGASTSTATTPVRRSKLQLTKAHTLARTDMTRARTQQRPPSDLIKSHSAASSPYHFGTGGGLLEERNSSSLLNSINKNTLEQSIAALLRSADTSMDSMISSIPFTSDTNQYGSLSASCSQVTAGSSTSVVSLLKQIGDIICQYYNEQQRKAQASSSNTSGFPVDFISDHWDALSISSPKYSICSGSTISSKTSSDLTSPLEGDQQLATHALDLLETLATYSRTVREQILLKPPEFHIPDSRPSSVLGVHHLEGEAEEKIQKSSTMSPTIQHLMKVSGRLDELQRETLPESSPEREESPPTPPPQQKVKSR